MLATDEVQNSPEYFAKYNSDMLGLRICNIIGLRGKGPVYIFRNLNTDLRELKLNNLSVEESRL